MELNYKLERRFELGKIIYPGIIARKCKLDIKDVYLVLEELCNIEICKTKLLIICPCCGATQPSSYETINNLPNFFTCCKCRQGDFSSIENTIICYETMG